MIFSDARLGAYYKLISLIRQTCCLSMYINNLLTFIVNRIEDGLHITLENT